MKILSTLLVTLTILATSCATEKTNRFIIEKYTSTSNNLCEYSARRDNGEEFIAPIKFIDSCGLYKIGDTVKLK